MIVFMSPSTQFTFHMNGERIKFQKGYLYVDKKSRAETIMKHPDYGLRFCLEEDYALRFGGESYANPSLMKNALLAAQEKGKVSGKKLSDLSSDNRSLSAENEALKAKLEALKKGKAQSVVEQPPSYFKTEVKEEVEKPKPKRKPAGKPRTKKGGR